MPNTFKFIRLLRATLLVYFCIGNKNTASSEFDKFCEDKYCPEFVRSSIVTPSLIRPAPILLGTDSEGCTCREDDFNMTVCFGKTRCTEIPKQFNITTAGLKITGTSIQQLSNDSFAKLHHLIDLKIDGNPKLETIEAFTFQTLSRLEHMCISFNMKLSHLHPQAFTGLASLKIIFFAQNNFHNLDMVAASLPVTSVPRLVELFLVENSFETVHEHDFTPMAGTKLRKLDLSLCRIQYLHPKCFLPLKNLQDIELSDNRFSSSSLAAVINASISAGIPLNTLMLFNLGFHKIPPRDVLEAVSRSNVTSLGLVKNQFEFLSNDSFPFWSPSLEAVDLSKVSLMNISKRAFNNLPNLKSLKISGNKLSTIQKNTMPKSLVFLDVQSNRINPNVVSFFILSDSVFTGLSRLEYLNLGYNSIESLANETFEGLENLKVLVLKNTTLFEIEDGTFLPLRNLEYLFLENTFFIQNNPSVFTSETFKGLGKLKKLHLGNCGLSYISGSYNPFKELLSLEQLCLSGNMLMSLSSNDFLPLKSLEILDLSGNLLVPWEERVFTHNTALTQLNLNRNKISHMSIEMLYDCSNLSKIQINDNPFGCFCYNYDIFHKWYVITKNKNFFNATIFNNIYCAFPSFLTNLTLIDFFESVYNRSMRCGPSFELTRNLLNFLPLAFVLISILSLALFMYYYRWHVRYWVFLTRLYLSRRGKIKHSKINDCPENTSFTYDAFVSYSSEDRDFVVRIIHMLENEEPFVKLCVYERDFEVGTMISENVLDCLANSRKTLLVISDNYAKSQWCKWESQIAEHHRLFFKNENGKYVNDSLVLVKLGVLNKRNLTPTLRYLLKTRIYLEWDSDARKERYFWSRLRSTLAPPTSSVDVGKICHL